MIDAVATRAAAPLATTADPPTAHHVALGGRPLVLGPPLRGRYARLKPALDFALALVLAPPALVLVALAALAVRLTSAGPAFYAQTRLGLGGRRFTLFKLRTMRHRCEALTGPRWSQPGDSRVTPVGRFLRATHLDELPQLWNVLRGEMSLVGPRPERPEIIEAQSLARLVPGYEERLRVKPGITGLAQLLLPPDTNVESVRRKVAFDLWYVENCGPWLDLRLLFGTILKLAGLHPRPPREAAALAAPHPTAPEASAPAEDADGGEWRATLAGLLAAPPAAPAPPAATDPRAEIRAWFRTTAVPALTDLMAELRLHDRKVRVAAGGPEEAWIRVWDRSGRRELDLKLRVRNSLAGPRVYARVLVRDGRSDFVHEYPLEKAVAELDRAEVIAFVLARYREGASPS